MKFQFSLEKVLRHRHLQVDLAQRDFMEAQNFLRDEIAVLDNMKQLKQDSLQQRAQLVSANQTWSPTIEQINLYVNGQDLRIKNQNQRLLVIEKQVEEKREILRNASIEVKIIEKLKEKKFEEFKTEQQRKEQSELDELSVLRFSRNESLIKGSHEDGI